MNNKMKIVVIGGTGLIGTKLVNNLHQRGHEVVAASPGLKPASMSDNPSKGAPSCVAPSPTQDPPESLTKKNAFRTAALRHCNPAPCNLQP
jgi:nucleoside-diphosphate-sugar epimerase